MIRITKQADYAIILLGQFVNSGNNTTYNARDLAGATKLPLPMVGKILKTLVRGSLLESHRGVKGGYALTRRPEEISVDEIIGVMEGPIGLTECTVHGDCEYETFCPARSNWNKINQAVLKALRGISLAEMAPPARNGKEEDAGHVRDTDDELMCDISAPLSERRTALIKETR